jgi:hypothetical protein
VDSEIIKALKENEKPFEQLNPDMQAVLRKVRTTDLEFTDGWHPIVNPGYRPQDKGVLRLRSDYEAPEEKPEIVECEIKNEDGRLQFNDSWNQDVDEWRPIYEAVESPLFTGFKYEDGRLRDHKRMYKNKVTGKLSSSILASSLHMYEVLTPTAVLFQKA